MVFFRFYEGAFIRVGRLLKSGHLLKHLRYFVNYMFLYFYPGGSDVEDDTEDISSEDLLKNQQAELEQEKQKLLQNHSMVEGVRWKFVYKQISVYFMHTMW